MSEPKSSEPVQPAGYEEDVRRLVLDVEQERQLEADLPNGRQAVVEPPVGTIGGPPTPPGDDVTTTSTRSIPTGGGPGDARRISDTGDQPAQATGRSEDSGSGASPDPT